MADCQAKLPTNSGLPRAVSTLGLQVALADPQTARPETILQLQRMVGNRAVTGLFQRQVVEPVNDPSASISGVSTFKAHL